jgi:hypothetical protein
VLQIYSKKNGAGWLKRLPCSGFLELAIKMPFWTILKFGHFGMKLDHVRPQITPFGGHFPRLSLSAQAIFATKESW